MTDFHPLPGTMPDSWEAVSDQALVEEVVREIGPDHALHGRHFVVLAKSTRTDDVLFRDIRSGEHFVIHLTWAGPGHPPWPAFTSVSSLDELEDENVTGDNVWNGEDDG